MSDNASTLTERGQVSVPASIRKAAGLRPGQTLRWELISATELRVILPAPDAPAGPFAALGFARRLRGGPRRSTDSVLRELRQGERE